MSDTTFALDRFLALAARLAGALEAHGPDAVYRAAEPLKVAVYKTREQLPFREVSPSTAPIAKVFPTAGALLDAVRSGDPSAVETGLSVLLHIAPEEAASF